jgi:hypothetical protein
MSEPVPPALEYLTQEDLAKAFALDGAAHLLSCSGDYDFRLLLRKGETEDGWALTERWWQDVDGCMRCRRLLVIGSCRLYWERKRMCKGFYATSPRKQIILK